MVNGDQINLTPHLSSERAMLFSVPKFLVVLVAVIHVAIAVIEIFFWGFPIIHNRLDFFTAADVNKVAPIVANAGLYNAFLAAGLIWGLRSGARSYQIKMFFLTCVIVAGIFGFVTLKPTTLVLQSIPGAMALLAVWRSKVSAERERTN